MSDYLTDEEVAVRADAFCAKYPDADRGLYSALVNRGHSDDEILLMREDEMFDEYCNWHGLINWGPRLRRILEETETMPNG